MKNMIILYDFFLYFYVVVFFLGGVGGGGVVNFSVYWNRHYFRNVFLPTLDITTKFFTVTSWLR